MEEQLTPNEQMQVRFPLGAPFSTSYRTIPTRYAMPGISPVRFLFGAPII